MRKKSVPLSKVYQLIEPGPVVMVSSRYMGKTNIMTMSWLMMVDFEPPLIAAVISNQNHSFAMIKKSKECVINIPTVELAQQVVDVGNTSGAKVDKFKKFNLTAITASHVDAPMIGECYANLECNVVDMAMATKYNIFMLKVVKAWITTAKKRPRTIHHCGNGVFVTDGKLIKLASKKK